MIEQIFLAPHHLPLGEALALSTDILQSERQDSTEVVALEMPMPAQSSGLDKRIQSIGLPLAFYFFSPDLNPVSLDADIAALSKARYHDAIDWALQCKVRYLLIPSLEQANYRVTGQYRAWFGRTVAFWESVLEKLPPHYPLTIVMTNYQDETPDTIATLAKRLNHPAFKIGFDTGFGRLFSQMAPVDWLSHMGDACCYVKIAHFSDDGQTLLPISDEDLEASTLANHLALHNRKLSVSLSGNSLSDTKQAYRWLETYLEIQESQYVSKRFLV